MPRLIRGLLLLRRFFLLLVFCHFVWSTSPHGFGLQEQLVPLTFLPTASTGS
jgi:hypothetical protein